MNSEETPSAAFVLSLIAGVLILAGGTASMMMGAFMSGWGVWGGMMGGGMMPWWSGFGLALGAVGIAIGVLVIIAALMLNSRPLQHVTWGTLILVLSIVSVVGGWGGFGIGLILGVIGGALAISWKPYTREASASAWCKILQPMRRRVASGREVLPAMRESCLPIDQSNHCPTFSGTFH